MDASHRVRIGKLTRPRLHSAVARERLFARLDRARQRTPGICVAGPPGAGKSTLVASWLDARGTPSIWYQVDPGDGDLATFFYYLGEAARAFARRGQRRLPLFTGEYLHDVEDFSRRFFRDLWAGLPDGAALVLDNYQEVAVGQPFHGLIAQALDELPEGLVVVLVSRQDPPNCYARLIANEHVTCMDWDELKLTLEEARSIALNRDFAHAADVESLHRHSGGWAAGFTLMLEGCRRNGGGTHGLPLGSDAIFDYFAAQILARLPDTVQRALVATAFLPQVPLSLAEALTADPDIAATLEDLYRRHLFVDRRPGIEPVYSYHALFRGFLKAQAGAVLGRELSREVLQRAAGLLADAGLPEEAFALYHDAGDWDGACGLILAQADRLQAQGRGQTLRDWIHCLPAAFREVRPWLSYWFGVSLMPVNQAQARACLERAFELFSRARDAHGQMSAASSIINSYFFEWSQWHELDHWVAALEALMLSSARYPSRTLEFDVHCSMLIATLYRQPGHPLLAVCADRVDAMLDADLDVNRKATGAALLLTYCNLAHRAERARRTVERAQTLIEHLDVTPLNRVWWYSRLTWYLVACGQYDLVAAPTRTAQELIERHGLRGLRSASMIVNAHLALAMIGLKEWKRAGELIAGLEASVQSNRASDVALAAELRTHLLVCKGELDEAQRSAEHAVQAAAATGMVSLEVLQRVSAMEVLAELGRYDEAQQHARRCYALVRDTCLSHRETELRVVEAYIARRTGSVQDCHALLRKAFGGAEGQWRNARLHGRILSAMCAEALDADIETTRVRAVIRRLGLAPPAQASEKWPWPVRIHCLGSFEVVVDDLPLAFGRKAPRKPLALLKVLVAFGGRGVPEQRLADALWPSEAGDAALQALDINLRRARALLGRQDAILVCDDAVSLNPELCWVDVWQFERLVEKAESRGGADTLPLLERACSVYRGNFLPMSVEEPWAAKPRERLRARFVSLVEACGARCEVTGNWERAIEYYRRGIEVDDLAEPFYQGLMRCYRAVGRCCEGMNAYRRLRHLMSVVLGMAPSEASQRLARALQNEQPAQAEQA